MTPEQLEAIRKRNDEVRDKHAEGCAALWEDVSCCVDVPAIAADIDALIAEVELQTARADDHARQLILLASEVADEAARLIVAMNHMDQR